VFIIASWLIDQEARKQQCLLRFDFHSDRFASEPGTLAGRQENVPISVPDYLTKCLIV
jgi:hypothetical protein